MAAILATGRHLPDGVLTNATLAAGIDRTEQWIVQRTGIHERRIADAGVGTARMAELAGRAALGNSSVAVEEIGVILVATSTPNQLTPPTACEVQAALGAFGAACFDVEAGFAGWLYGLIIADALLAAGPARYALVIGSEKLSTVTNRSDPATSPLFGDGAGAVVLGPERNGGLRLGARSWWADGRLADALRRPAGGAERPFDRAVLDEGTHLLRMEGTRLFRQAVRTMAAQARQVLESAGLSAADVRLVVPHQANLRILHAFADELRIDVGRVFINIDRYGNTGSATIPIALDEALGAVPARAADGPVLLVSFGAGATAGALLLEPASA